MLVERALIYIIIFLAALTQSLTGFGSALVAMALLPALIGLQTSVPLVALIALSIELVLLLRYRQDVSLKAVKPLIIASIIGIPIGIYLLRQVDEKVMLAILGMVITGYAIYALSDLHMPKLEQPAWAYAAGFLAGMFGGAYNTSGPPVILYADCRRWPPDEFKGNLQGFFLINSIFVVGTHLLSNNYTSEIWRYFVFAIPVIAFGLIIGTRASRALPPAAFRKVMLVVLVVMGARMTLAAL